MPVMSNVVKGSLINGRLGAHAPFKWNATDVAATGSFYIAPRDMRVVSIVACVDVQGTDGGAVTAVINKVPSGTTASGGTALHTGSIDLKGTDETNQALTLSTTAGVTYVAKGTRLAFVLTGTSTAAVGCLTVCLVPA